MFGGSCDLAILSSPLALHRAKWFWWSGYAIAGHALPPFVWPHYKSQPWERTIMLAQFTRVQRSDMVGTEPDRMELYRK
ncbi:MAG: hypothetical protein GDA36_02310 [Rhodobacteraceae bacterium]|nr:hypothetical protein [Paracoccaceae bacterium]